MMADEYAVFAASRPDRETARRLEALDRAADAISDALRATSLVEERGTWEALQQQYFGIVAQRRALDPHWPRVHITGTDLNTRRDGARTLDAVTVCDPTNPTTTHAVTIDHEITPDGSVTCEINGVTIDRLVTDSGSHIR